MNGNQSGQLFYDSRILERLTGQLNNHISIIYKQAM